MEVVEEPEAVPALVGEEWRGEVSVGVGEKLATGAPVAHGAERDGGGGAEGRGVVFVRGDTAGHVAHLRGCKLNIASNERNPYNTFFRARFKIRASDKMI